MSNIMHKKNFTEKSLRNFYYVVFRHKNKILAFFFAVTVIVSLATLLASEIFLSEAKLMLLPSGRESVTLGPTVSTEGQVVNISQDREKEINSELAILQSRKLAEEVVDAIGVQTILNGPDETFGPGDSTLKKIRHTVKQWSESLGVVFSKIVGSTRAATPIEELRKRDAAIRSLMNNLSIEAEKLSNIISISFEAKSPEMASDVLTKLIDLYLVMHINAYRANISSESFNQLKGELHIILSDSEQELRNLKNDTGIASLPEQRRILLERIGGLQRELQKTESDIAASSAGIRALQGKLASIPQTLVTAETSGLPDSAADDLRKRLHELQLKEQEILSRHTEKSIPVKKVRRQIVNARSLLLKAEQPRQVTTGINATHQEIQSLLLREEGNLSALQAKSEVLKEQLTKGGHELKTLNDKEIRLAPLQREMEILESNYRKYSGGLERFRIDQALESEKVSNISVVQPASYSVANVKPRHLVNLIVAVFLGVFGGLGLAFFTEYMDHSFRRPEDTEQHLQLPTLAAIPHYCEKALNGITRSKIATTCIVIEEPGGSISGRLDIPPKLREYYDTLLERLINPAGHSTNQLRALALTSFHTGEGVTSTATHLAMMLARYNEGRVLLVDSNFQHPSVHSRFGVDLSPGLAEIISDGQGHTTNIKPSPVGKLDLLCAGRENADLGRFPESKAFMELLSLWRREYTFIIFDTPPLCEANDAVILGSLVDAVVLVVEAGKVRWEAARPAKGRLEDASANVVGAILTKRRFYIPEWLYRTL